LILNCSDTEDVEAKVAVKAISLLVGSRHEKIILEMDCSRVVAAMSSPGIDRSMQWATYEEAKSLSKTFSDFRVVSVMRESNMVTL
jgi:hypothetical protein